MKDLGIEVCKVRALLCGWKVGFEAIFSGVGWQVCGYGSDFSKLGAGPFKV